ncbi:hypothetical protein N8D56_22270 [Devosia sp. A8/3-2]|nr:hypothetical protein N8D56_22270 [Devosia sp. A8/3-2]
MNAMTSMLQSETTTDLAIAMRGVTKIFGSNPQAALALLQSGKSKDEVRGQKPTTSSASTMFLPRYRAGTDFCGYGAVGIGQVDPHPPREPPDRADSG